VKKDTKRQEEKRDRGRGRISRRKEKAGPRTRSSGSYSKHNNEHNRTFSQKQ